MTTSFGRTNVTAQIKDVKIRYLFDTVVASPSFVYIPMHFNIDDGNDF